ncbi:MAG: hypothetical protein ABFD92_16860 [Planctomycetaceae bacterium]|nr:hypothetical protein [Planctomycetaceae bacterium]
MADEVIRARVDLETLEAERNASRLGQAMNKAGQSGAAGIKPTQGAVEALTGSLKNAFHGVVALGASYLSLQALMAAIQKINASYERSIKLRDEATRGVSGAWKQVAPAAAQFGVSEDAMRQYVMALAKRAGAAPSDIGSIANLITQASSSGIIGNITENAQGQVVASATDTNKLSMMATFAQFTAEPEVGPDLAKLLRKGMGTDNSTEGLAKSIGQTMQAFRGSQMSRWSEFISGAVSGGSTLLEQGVSYQTVLSAYSGAAKMTRSGNAAGELLRIIGGRFFASDDPKVREFIDQKYGQGAYWRMKEKEPDKLFRSVLDTLTTGTPEQRAELYDALEIPTEQREQLARMAGGRAEMAKVEAMVGQGTGEAAQAELARWRRGGRAVLQAGELEGANISQTAGADPGETLSASLRSISQEEMKLWNMQEPGTFAAEDMVTLDRDMVNKAMTRYVKRKLKGKVAGSENIAVDVTGSGVTLSYETPLEDRGYPSEDKSRKEEGIVRSYGPAVGEVLGEALGVPVESQFKAGDTWNKPSVVVNVGVVYPVTPTDAANTDQTRASGAK